jgi:hypothetical protein
MVAAGAAMISISRKGRGRPSKRRIAILRVAVAIVGVGTCLSATVAHSAETKWPVCKDSINTPMLVFPTLGNVCPDWAIVDEYRSCVNNALARMDGITPFSEWPPFPECWQIEKALDRALESE